MTPNQRNGPLVVALYLNGVLLLAILVTMLSRGSGGWPATASAAVPPIAPQPIAGNGSLYLMPGQLLNNVWGCYILDVDGQTLCVYGYTGSQLKLLAARNIRYDHALNAHNTQPDPEEIRKIVEQEIQKIGAAGQPPKNGPSPAVAPPETQPDPK